MAGERRHAITITLSPTQVDEVMRAVSHSRAPSISALVGAYQPIDAADPRLSRSLLRGMALLSCIGADDGARGIVELAGELGMSASTAHRYALTLVELGLLEQCPLTRKYRLPVT